MQEELQFGSLDVKSKPDTPQTSQKEDSILQNYKNPQSFIYQQQPAYSPNRPPRAQSSTTQKSQSKSKQKNFSLNVNNVQIQDFQNFCNQKKEQKNTESTQKNDKNYEYSYKIENISSHYSQEKQKEPQQNQEPKKIIEDTDQNKNISNPNQAENQYQQQQQSNFTQKYTQIIDNFGDKLNNIHKIADNYKKQDELIQSNIEKIEQLSDQRSSQSSSHNETQQLSEQQQKYKQLQEQKSLLTPNPPTIQSYLLNNSSNVQLFMNTQSYQNLLNQSNGNISEFQNLSKHQQHTSESLDLTIQEKSFPEKNLFENSPQDYQYWKEDSQQKTQNYQHQQTQNSFDNTNNNYNNNNKNNNNKAIKVSEILQKNNSSQNILDSLNQIPKVQELSGLEQQHVDQQQQPVVFEEQIFKQFPQIYEKSPYILMKNKDFKKFINKQETYQEILVNQQQQLRQIDEKQSDQQQQNTKLIKTIQEQQITIQNLQIQLKDILKFSSHNNPSSIKKRQKQLQSTEDILKYVNNQNSQQEMNDESTQMMIGIDEEEITQFYNNSSSNQKYSSNEQAQKKQKQIFSADVHDFSTNLTSNPNNSINKTHQFSTTLSNNNSQANINQKKSFINQPIRSNSIDSNFRSLKSIEKNDFNNIQNNQNIQNNHKLISQLKNSYESNNNSNNSNNKPPLQTHRKINSLQESSTVQNSGQKAEAGKITSNNVLKKSVITPGSIFRKSAECLNQIKNIQINNNYNSNNILNNIKTERGKSEPKFQYKQTPSYNSDYPLKEQYEIQPVEHDKNFKFQQQEKKQQRSVSYSIMPRQMNNPSNNNNNPTSLNTEYTERNKENISSNIPKQTQNFKNYDVKGIKNINIVYNKNSNSAQYRKPSLNSRTEDRNVHFQNPVSGNANKISRRSYNSQQSKQYIKEQQEGCNQF